jgi:Ca-activated chloride channel family protein
MAGEQRRFTLSRSFPEQDGDREYLPRLWAVRRVGYLLDQIRLHGESTELRDEAATLARRYGIVTPYTSWLILEDEGRRKVAAADRTLREFDADPRARAEAKRIYADAQAEASGAGAVGDAQAFDALSRADKPSAPAAANAFTFKGQAGREAGAADVVARAVDRQQTNAIAGRTFSPIAQLWVDARAQERPDARRERVPFGSDAYFALLDRDPAAPRWLAQGRNVVVLLGDTIYEVVD